MATNWLAQGPAARDDRGGALRKDVAIAPPLRSTSSPLPHHGAEDEVSLALGLPGAVLLSTIQGLRRHASDEHHLQRALHDATGRQSTSRAATNRQDRPLRASRLCRRTAEAPEHRERQVPCIVSLGNRAARGARTSSASACPGPPGPHDPDNKHHRPREHRQHQDLHDVSRGDPTSRGARTSTTAARHSVSQRDTATEGARTPTASGSSRRVAAGHGHRRRKDTDSIGIFTACLSGTRRPRLKDIDNNWLIARVATRHAHRRPKNVDSVELLKTFVHQPDNTKPKNTGTRKQGPNRNQHTGNTQKPVEHRVAADWHGLAPFVGKVAGAPSPTKQGRASS